MSVEFKIVYPGVYDKDEKELLDITLAYLSGGSEELAAKLQAQLAGKQQVGRMELNGGLGLINTTLGTNDLINRAYWSSQPNPLYADPEYSKQTIWGGHLAAPFTVEIGPSFAYIPKGTDIWVSNDDFTIGRGLDHEVTFYKPMYAGDSVYSVLTRQACNDVTSPEGSTMRKFRVIGESELYNSRGEKLMSGYYSAIETFKLFKDRSMVKEYDKPLTIYFARYYDWDRIRPMHIYTDQDWDFIKSLWSKERIRSTDTLYWEDVNIGDEPPWTCDGPVTEEDRWKGGGGGGLPPMRPVSVRDMLMNPVRNTSSAGPAGAPMGPTRELHRDSYGIYHVKNTDMKAGAESARHPNARSSFMNTAGRDFAVRMVTNWMGNDGWLHKIAWRLAFCWDEGRNMFPENHDRPSYLLKVPYLKEQSKFMNTHGYVGDLAITKGYVCDKYVKNGAHYVDLVVWCETIEGDIWAECYAVVELPTRNNKKTTACPQASRQPW